ncbi:hypothetical protein MSAN_00193200 [Mycena sanguinolenta]|uniref:Uncharacterized protein n=1 Tax=Mycena sanguinolenta TaxID=230812 RepID=A0A8H6ZH62_9AGAR|nr:hypothetical protein MSAN_00193200 [Mycena sanguinolenta]
MSEVPTPCSPQAAAEVLASSCGDSLQFPQELVDWIIDNHVSDDVRLLKTCSLISWAWVPRCRSYLFKKLPDLIPQNILVLGELLRSPHCTFLSHVRSISAFRYTWYLNDRYFNQVVADLPRLTNVHILEIPLTTVNTTDPDAAEHASSHTGFVTAGVPTVMHRVFTAFPHVTRLKLNCFLEPTMVIDLICLLPALKELWLHSGYNLDMRRRGMVPVVADPPLNAVPPRGLHCLALSGDAVGFILAWLNATEHLPNVSSVALSSDIEYADVPILQAALQQLGEHEALHHLDITLYSSLGYGALTMFDFSKHLNLRTLAICDVRWVGPYDLEVEQMLKLITKLAAPTLECFTLDVDLLLYQTLDWSVLDSFLCRARFPRLQSVKIEDRYPRVRTRSDTDIDYHAEQHKFLPGVLPLLEAAGLLQTYTPQIVRRISPLSTRGANRNTVQVPQL